MEWKKRTNEFFSRSEIRWLLKVLLLFFLILGFDFFSLILFETGSMLITGAIYTAHIFGFYLLISILMGIILTTVSLFVVIYIVGRYILYILRTNKKEGDNQ